MTPGKQLFDWIMKIFWLGLALIIVLISVWSWRVGPWAMSQGVAAAQPYFLAWRALLLIALIGGWPLLVGRLARHFRFSLIQQQALLAVRWRLALWLILIEILLVQGVLGQFFLNIWELT